jgi:hypothetical protein
MQHLFSRLSNCAVEMPESFRTLDSFGGGGFDGYRCYHVSGRQIGPSHLPAIAGTRPMLFV